jgi:hypothetical protein
LSLQLRGRQPAVRNIENVKVGDKALSRDQNNREAPTEYRTVARENGGVFRVVRK